MQTKFTDLTASQSQHMEKILENVQGKRKWHHDRRQIFNAILWITRTGVHCFNL
jgi:hypothetical protein